MRPATPRSPPIPSQTWTQARRLGASMLGRTVNRYRVVARLGEGGMGTVWQAEDLELGRQVALKFLPRSLVDSPEARRRLMREAHAASRLEHPGIATLYNVEEFESELFLVYAYVDGAPVTRLVEEGPLPIAEALRIACAALDALDHAHARHVIHRDVTSGNILVTRDRRVVLIDFGLALRPDTSRITSSGTMLGTLSYLAPEALRG